MNLAARIRVLEDENDALRERVAWLESQLRERGDAPIEMCLTPHEGQLLMALLSRDVMSKEAILTAMYGDRPDGDTPEIKIIDVFICKLRKKLLPFGLDPASPRDGGLKTAWGRGYYLTPVAKASVRAMLRQQKGDAA